jgi:hypothetical protein
MISIELHNLIRELVLTSTDLNPLQITVGGLKSQRMYQEKKKPK